MGRFFTVPINVASHTAAIDIVELATATNKPCRLVYGELSQASDYGDAQEEVIPLIVYRVTGSPTSGSGGSSVTPVPIDPGTSIGATAEVGNTTQLSGGTATEILRIGWNIRGGTVFAPPPELWAAALGDDHIVIREANAPADSITGPIGFFAFEEVI